MPEGRLIEVVAQQDDVGHGASAPLPSRLASASRATSTPSASSSAAARRASAARAARPREVSRALRFEVGGVRRRLHRDAGGRAARGCARADRPRSAAATQGAPQAIACNSVEPPFAMTSRAPRMSAARSACGNAATHARRARLGGAGVLAAAGVLRRTHEGRRKACRRELFWPRSETAGRHPPRPDVPCPRRVSRPPRRGSSQHAERRSRRPSSCSRCAP